MRKSLFILLLLVSFYSNAQLNSSISFSPTALVFNPILRLGYEVELAPKTFLQVELGYGRNFKNVTIFEDYIPYSKYQLRGTLKQKFFKRNGKGANYIFLDVFANLHTKHFNKHSIFYLSKYSDMYYDRVDMRIFKAGINVGYGFEVKISNRISLDFYLGAGFADRVVSYHNAINPILQMHNEYYGGMLNLGKYEIPESRIVFSSKTGINLIYKIGNRIHY